MTDTKLQIQGVKSTLFKVNTTLLPSKEQTSTIPKHLVVSDAICKNTKIKQKFLKKKKVQKEKHSM